MMVRPRGGAIVRDPVVTTVLPEAGEMAQMPLSDHVNSLQEENYQKIVTMCEKL